MSHAKHIAITA